MAKRGDGVTCIEVYASARVIRGTRIWGKQRAPAGNHILYWVRPSLPVYEPTNPSLPKLWFCHPPPLQPPAFQSRPWGEYGIEFKCGANENSHSSTQNYDNRVSINIVSLKLTAANRHVFSRRAPTHPANPITNVTVPTNKIKNSINFWKREEKLNCSKRGPSLRLSNLTVDIANAASFQSHNPQSKQTCWLVLEGSCAEWGSGRSGKNWWSATQNSLSHCETCPVNLLNDLSIFSATVYTR